MKHLITIFFLTFLTMGSHSQGNKPELSPNYPGNPENHPQPITVEHIILCNVMVLHVTYFSFLQSPPSWRH